LHNKCLCVGFSTCPLPTSPVDAHYTTVFRASRKWGRFCPPPAGLIRVQPLGTESLERARFFRAQLQQGKHALLPSPPVSPSPARRERGNTQLLPSPTQWERGGGEGEKREHLARSEPKRCTLISSCRFPPLREGNQTAVPPARRGNLKRGSQKLSCNEP